MAPEIPYRECGVRWLRTILGESRSERRSKSLRDCVLCFGDEVCIYHRDGEFYDHIIKVGLPILKVRPVESRQPRSRRSEECSEREALVIFHFALDATIAFATADVSSFVELLFSFADGKFKLHESPLNIQTNGDQSQALGPGFSNEGTDF